MPSQFYLVDGGGAHEVATVPQAVLQTFREDPLECVLFDVGRGEAIVVRRKRRAITVDGGKGLAARQEEVAGKILSYLENHDAKIKALIATHPHLDHLNALPVLLEDENLGVLTRRARLYGNGYRGTSKRLQEHLFARLEELETQGVVRWVKIPDQAGAQLKVRRIFRNTTLWMTVDGKWQPKPVYRSVFALVRYRRARILLTGDAYGLDEAGKRYEQKLLEKHAGDGYFRPVDVLKVTHHGSEGGTGQPFVDAIRPKIAVSSSGDPSHEGHRFEEVTRDRLEDQPGTQEIRTTHENGDIVIRTDGRIVNLGGRRGILYELEIDKEAESS